MRPSGAENSREVHGNNAPLPENAILNNYQIIRTIARGASSYVYLAKNQHKHLVAIKEYIPQKFPLRDQAELDLIILPEHGREFRQYLKTFISEYRTLSCVSHPGIVCLIDFFCAHNTFYIVTKYEEGSSLKAFLQRRLDNRMGYKKDSLLNAYLRYQRYKKRSIGSRQLIGERFLQKIFSQLIDAISALHDKQYLYLDLKPANIYLYSDGNPVLLDLGAARRTSEKNWRKLNWVYTKGFAAPELLQRQRTLMGPWTDAYGIGATIFACLCGHPPHCADERAVEDKLPLSLKALRKIYSSDLVDLIEWCLHLDPERRPQTMAALQERLSACRPNPAPPPGRKFIKRFSKWIRRKMKTAPPVPRCS